MEMSYYDSPGFGTLCKLPRDLRIAIFKACFSPRSIAYHPAQDPNSDFWEEHFDNYLFLVSRSVSREAQLGKDAAYVHLTISNYKNVPTKAVRDVVTRICVETGRLGPPKSYEPPGHPGWKGFPAHEYPSLRQLRFSGDYIEGVMTHELGGTFQDLMSGKLDQAMIQYLQCTLNISDARQLLEHHDALMNRPTIVFEIWVFHSFSHGKIHIVIEVKDSKWEVVERKVDEENLRTIDAWSLEHRGVLASQDFSRAGAFTTSCTHRVDPRYWCSRCKAIKLLNKHG